jgi:predicted nucleic acid-binding protein
VRLVIADTSPINYLLLIGYIEILPALFDRVIVPSAVWDELKHPKAPPIVRDFVAASPAWVEVRENPEVHDAILDLFDAGERPRLDWPSNSAPICS